MRENSLFDQVYNDIIGRVVSGRIRPGSKFYSKEEIAQKYRINRNLTDLVFQQLRHHGIILVEEEGDHILTRDINILKDQQARMLEELIEDYFKKAHQLGVSKEEAAQRLFEKGEDGDVQTRG